MSSANFSSTGLPVLGIQSRREAMTQASRRGDPTFVISPHHSSRRYAELSGIRPSSGRPTEVPLLFFSSPPIRENSRKDLWKCGRQRSSSKKSAADVQVIVEKSKTFPRCWGKPVGSHAVHRFSPGIVNHGISTNRVHASPLGPTGFHLIPAPLRPSVRVDGSDHRGLIRYLLAPRGQTPWMRTIGCWQPPFY